MARLPCPGTPRRDRSCRGRLAGVFGQIEASLGNKALEARETYLHWQFANPFAAKAGGRFDDEHFHYFETILNGTTQQRPRLMRVLDAEEVYLGDALGQLYVRRYFSPQQGALRETHGRSLRAHLSLPQGSSELQLEVHC